MRLMTSHVLARSSLVFCALLAHSVYAEDTDGDGLSDTGEITVGTNPAVGNFICKAFKLVLMT